LQKIKHFPLRYVGNRIICINYHIFILNIIKNIFIMINFI